MLCPLTIPYAIFTFFYIYCQTRELVSTPLDVHNRSSFPNQCNTFTYLPHTNKNKRLEAMTKFTMTHLLSHLNGGLRFEQTLDFKFT